MSDASFLALALLGSVASMTLFALSLDAHWRQLLGARPLPRALRIGLRFGGAVLLGLVFGFCLMADPASMAALVWPMLLALAAVIVALSLAVHARLVLGQRRR